jgi:hypothetical protein
MCVGCANRYFLLGSGAFARQSCNHHCNPVPLLYHRPASLRDYFRHCALRIPPGVGSRLRVSRSWRECRSWHCYGKPALYCYLQFPPSLSLSLSPLLGVYLQRSLRSPYLVFTSNRPCNAFAQCNFSPSLFFIFFKYSLHRPCNAFTVCSPNRASC